MFDVIGKRRWFYAISLILTIPGLVFILLTPFTDAGLQFSIDYTGGTRWEIKFEDASVTPDQVEAVFAEHGLEATADLDRLRLHRDPDRAARRPAAAGTAGDPGPDAGASPRRRHPGHRAHRARRSASAGPEPGPVREPVSRAVLEPVRQPLGRRVREPIALGVPVCGAGRQHRAARPTGQLGEVRAALEDELGPIVAQNSLTTIGAVVSSDLITQALILIIVGSIGILLWITYRFRDVKFGVTALVALLHDVIVVVGFFALLGTFFGVQIDALFVTAMLTIIGFSVHDTIVVFDRVRENKARHAGEPFADIVNHSILQTFGRSITTSLTVVLTLLALLLFGGSAINDFILALLIGIVSGTYSSIFVASPLLVDWHLWEDRRHGRVATTRAPRTRRSVS